MIKKLEKNDWKKWKEIRLEALKKSPDSFLSSFEEESKNSDEFWLEQLEQSLKFGYFIDDKIIGCCVLSIEKAAKIAHTATVFGMYVKDSNRGSGIGLALVDFVKIYAKQNCIKHLYLGCNAQNFSAIKLYRKCGFKVYGTRPDPAFIGNALHILRLIFYIYISLKNILLPINF